MVSGDGGRVEGVCLLSPFSLQIVQEASWQVAGFHLVGISSVGWLRLFNSMCIVHKMENCFVEHAHNNISRRGLSTFTGSS